MKAATHVAFAGLCGVIAQGLQEEPVERGAFFELGHEESWGRPLFRG